MTIKKKLILLSSCLILTGFSLVRTVTGENVKEVEAAEESTWELVEPGDDGALNLKLNDKVIMVAAKTTNNYVMSTNTGSNNRLTSVDITINNKIISNLPTTALQMTVDTFSSTSKEMSFKIINLNNHVGDYLAYNNKGFSFDSAKYTWKYETGNNNKYQYPEYYTFDFSNNDGNHITYNISSSFFGCYTNLQNSGKTGTTNGGTSATIALFKLKEASKVTVNYYLNDGTENMFGDPDEFELNTPITKKAEIPTRQEDEYYTYEFEDWYTSEDNGLHLSDESFEFGKTYSEATTINLYAKWNAHSKKTTDIIFKTSETNMALAFDFKEKQTEGQKETITGKITYSDSIETEGQGKFDSNSESTYKDGELKLSGDHYISYTFIEGKALNSLNDSISVSLSVKNYSGTPSKGYSTLQLFGYNSTNDEEALSEILEVDAPTNNFKLIELSNTKKIDKSFNNIKIKFTKIGYNIAVKQVNVEYSNSKKEVSYFDFKNLSIKIKYSFDFSAVEDVDKTGLIVTGKNPQDVFNGENKSFNEEEFTALISDPSTRCFENYNKLNEYIVSITNIQKNNLNTSLLAFAYVKVGDTYYFNIAKQYSFADILEEYYALHEDDDIDLGDGDSVKLGVLVDAAATELGLEW